MKQSSLLKKIKNQKALILISLPFIAYIIVFSYIPMAGLIMAFQDFDVTSDVPIFKQPLIGWANFKELFAIDEFSLAFRNTVIMGVLNLVSSTIAGVFLALVLSEVKNKGLKKTTQLISYFPHFISWVIVTNFIVNFLSLDGLLNKMLMGIGILDKPVLFMAEPKYFWVITTLSYVWKGVGYGSIVYLSAIVAIDPAIYEAAVIDGAGRIKKITKITIPCIMPTIQLLFIMNCGWVIGSGFEQQMLLKNTANQQYAQVIDLFVLKYGTSQGRLSFATAAGLFKSVVSVILLATVNFIGKKINGISLF